MQHNRTKGIRWSVTIAAMLGGLGFVSTTLAQNDDYELTRELEQKNANVVEMGGVLDERNFNSWIFGNAQALTLKSEPPQLAVIIADLDRSCSLTPAQKQKLELAAKTDLRFFLDDVEAAREQFLKFKTQQEVFNEFYGNVIRPLAMRRSAGFLGHGSLFNKVVDSTLTPDQLKAYSEGQLERRKYHYKASINAALLSLSEAAGLSAKQHETLAAHMLENTKPPLVTGRQDRQYVYYQLSQLQDEQFEKTIGKEGGAKLKRLVAPYAGMKQSLISIGMLPAR